MQVPFDPTVLREKGKVQSYGEGSNVSGLGSWMFLAFYHTLFALGDVQPFLQAWRKHFHAHARLKQHYSGFVSITLNVGGDTSKTRLIPCFSTLQDEVTKCKGLALAQEHGNRGQTRNEPPRNQPLAAVSGSGHRFRVGRRAPARAMRA